MSIVHSRGKQGPSAVAFSIAISSLFVLCVLLQIVRDGRYAKYRAETALLYIPAGAVLQGRALSFDALLADWYWIRAIQHYGSKKRSEEESKQYDLLYPLLDITTSLDPRFNMAYRFGSIFLAESYPHGPGRADLAIELLQKGIREMPERWRYLQDIGFIHYWWLHDYEGAAEWFHRASEVPGASWWLKSLAANTMTEGGNRSASRMLWSEIYESADNEWIRGDALRRLQQLRALDEIDQLTALVEAFEQRASRRPTSWQELIPADLSAMPIDPAGLHVYALDPSSGKVSLGRGSPLAPLPAEPPALSSPAR